MTRRTLTLNYQHHTSPITTVDTLAHRSLIATGGYDGRVILWSEELAPQWHFQAPDLVNQVVFSPNGTIVAAASADGFVYLLRVADGSVRGRLGPFADDVNAVAWHPRGEMIACVMDAEDKVVRLLNIHSGDEVRRLEGHQHGVFAVAFDPLGHRLATAAEDRSARIWELKTGRQVEQLDHPGDPETLAWSPTKPDLATGCDDGVLRVWNVDTGRLVATSATATAAVRFVRYSDDGELLLSGSYDGHLRVLDARSLAVRSALLAPRQWERAAAFLADSIVVGSFGQEPVIHRSGQESNRVSATYGINAVTVGARGDILAGRDDGAIVDVNSRRIVYRHDSIVNAVAYNDDGTKSASCDYLGAIVILDLRDSRIIAQRRVSSGPINSVVWLPGGGLATAGYDGLIRVWSNDLEPEYDMQAHDGPIKSLCFSRPADVLIAGSSDNTISAWRQNHCIYRIARTDLILINSVAAAAAAPVFSSASRDGRIRLWAADTGTMLRQMPNGHRKSVKSIAISSDGRRLVSGSYDGSAILWQIRPDGSLRQQTLSLHGKPGVPAVAFFEETALTAGWNGSIGRWSSDGNLLDEWRLHELELT